MDIYEVIKSRRSTRKYKQTPVEPEKLEMIISAGRYAPSGGNSQRSHIFVVQNKDVLDELAAMAREAFAEMEIEESMYGGLKNSIRLSKRGDYVFHFDAPVLIVIANEMAYGNHMADTALVVENMLLQANALDLGSCYINQLNWLGDDERFRNYMANWGLKEEERVYASLVVGYPDTEDGLPVRIPLQRTGNEVVYID